MPQHRFQFDITEEQNARALKAFSYYGQRKAVMGRILDELLNMVEEHGQWVFGVITDEGTEIRKIIPSMARAERMAKKNEGQTVSEVDS